VGDLAEYVSGILGKDIKPKLLSDQIAQLKKDPRLEKTKNGIIFPFRGLKVEREKASPTRYKLSFGGIIALSSPLKEIQLL